MRLRLLLLPVVLAASLMSGVARAAVSDPIDPTVPVAAASWGTDRIDLFAKGTDGALKHKVYNGRWSAWESLGGAITSGPAAVSWGPGRIDVFARGTDGSVQHKAYANGTWSGWANLGGVIVGEPAVTSWGPNHLDVYVRGTTNALHHKGHNGSAWQTSWTNLGGTLTSSPTAASWAQGRIDVFARGGGNALHHRWYTGGNWSAWENLGGVLTSAPAVQSGGSGFLDVYARVANNAVSHKSFGFGQWAGWENLGGTFATAPAVSKWGGSHLDVFARGTDGTLQQRTWHGIFGWAPAWQVLPDAASTVPVPAYSRTVAVQASPVTGALVGALEYAYVDNIGRIVHGRQPDPGNANTVQWTVISGSEAFAGPPGLVEQPNKRVQVSALHASGDVWARAQTGQGAATWTGWIDQGGQLTGAVTVARQTDDAGNIVALAVDSAGAAWYLTQSNVAGPYGTWRSLGVTGLVGTLTAVAGRDGLQLFGVDTAGAVRTATLSPAGTVSAWTDLAGVGLTGSPAVVVYPGYRMRIFARAADGTVVTKAQDAALTWSAAWSAVGAQMTEGSPAAVLSPQSGRTEILARGTDGGIYSTGETTQGSGVWRDWMPVLQGGDVAATDPTALTYADGAGQRWAFVFRTPDQQSRLYTVDTGPGLLAVGGGPRFQAARLPAPPR
ncbi:hypothetical protein WEI85_24080 [Actinomycetes bacterium KLBMP 9797]